MSITKNMLDAMVKNKIEFVTTVPCKQLSGIIELLENDERILHVPVSYTHLTLPTSIQV